MTAWYREEFPAPTMMSVSKNSLYQGKCKLKFKLSNVSFSCANTKQREAWIIVLRYPEQSVVSVRARSAV